MRTQALAAAGAATQPRHLGVDGGLIEEDEPPRLASQAWLARLDPVLPARGDVGPGALGGHQLFSYM
jgi:hypothetical protein